MLTCLTVIQTCLLLWVQRITSGKTRLYGWFMRYAILQQAIVGNYLGLALVGLGYWQYLNQTGVEQEISSYQRILGYGALSFLFIISLLMGVIRFQMA